MCMHVSAHANLHSSVQVVSTSGQQPSEGRADKTTVKQKQRSVGRADIYIHNLLAEAHLHCLVVWAAPPCPAVHPSIHPFSRCPCRDRLHCTALSRASYCIDIAITRFAARRLKCFSGKPELLRSIVSDDQKNYSAALIPFEVKSSRRKRLKHCWFSNIS